MLLMKQVGETVVFNERERKLSGYGLVLLAAVPVTVEELKERSQAMIAGTIASSLGQELEIAERMASEELEDAVEPYAMFQRGVDLGMLAERLDRFRLPGKLVSLPEPTAAQYDQFLEDLNRAS